MADDDDIAAFLPTPPQPAPAPRAAAIDMAMRRFDGLDPAPRAAVGKPGPTRASFWTTPRRGLAGALLTGALVALVGAPIAWQRLRERAPVESGQPHRSLAPTEAQPRQPAEMAAASPVSPAAPSHDALAAPRPEAPAQASSDQAASAEPPPPPPPPPPATQMADARPLPPAASAKAAPSPGDARGMMANRMAAPPAAPPVAVAEAANDNAAVIVTGTRIRAPSRAASRGDWNACTVDDPARSLSSCRKQVDRAFKGPAAAQVAEGLTRAWEGDTDQAIAAFDRAIAAAPKSSFAYLNRGLAWRRSGNLARALADLDRAVKYGPSEARNYYNRSLVLFAQGAAARALRDEQRAVDLDPDYADVVH